MKRSERFARAETSIATERDAVSRTVPSEDSASRQASGHTIS